MFQSIDLDEPDEILREMSRLDRCIEELRDHRSHMLERIGSSRGVPRLARNINFLLSQKQIVRHLRLYKIQRERLEMHYERLHGELPASEDMTGEQDSGSSY